MPEGPDRANQTPDAGPRARPSRSISAWAGLVAGVTTFSNTHGLILLVVAVVFWLTVPYSQADSPGYANEVVQYREIPLLSQGNILWEFGHLVWRPLGWVLLQLAGPWENAATAWDAALLVLRALTLVSLATALVTVVLWHSLALRASRSRRVAFAVTVGLAFTHSFLLYAQNGSSYIPGLCFATLGLWLVVEAMERPSRGKLLPVAAGCAVAISALLWFPYILSVPGVAAAAIFWQGSIERPATVSCRDRLRVAALIVSCFTLVLITVYVTMGWVRGIRSISQHADWLGESSHGVSQSLNLVRMATGLPRSFINLDRDGVLWKRFLFHDPYAPVGLLDLLLRGGLWKLAAFYAMAAAIVWNCWKSPGGRRSLAILAAGATPVFLFAVFLFEASGPERYFPAFAFLALALASAAGASSSSRTAALSVMIPLGLMAATNLYSMSSRQVSLGVDETLDRLAPLKANLRPESVVFALSYADRACSFRRDYPFHAFNSDGGIVILDLVEIAAERVNTWKEEFAHNTLQTWESGGDVWVTQRVWAERPLPDWYWTEGDDPRISWTDLPAFFQLFEIGGRTEGDDGFNRIKTSDANRRLLTDVLAVSGRGAQRGAGDR